MNDDKRALIRVLREHSLRVGEFVLSSGKKSNYYLDCRVTTLHPEGALRTARLILSSVKEHGIEVDAIGGLTLGADPIVAAVAAVSATLHRPLPGFIVRKQAKQHGEKRLIEGWQGEPGSKVLVVDDVCTSGGSILEACDRAEEAGYHVAATMCVVDREEGGTEAVRDRYPFYPLLTARDLLASPAS
jgi:orotate phosphoribosyltransferase